jgi:hypothetical protein
MMRILGEGGADAPSSGQDGACGAGRRIGRFGPVRHFPSHSLQSTAARSACTDVAVASRDAHPEFPGECRSGGKSATPSRQPAAHRGAPEHPGGASDHPRAAVRRIGLIPAPATGYPPEWALRSDHRSAPVRPPGALPGAFYAHSTHEGRFSANFQALPSGSDSRRLTPLPPAVLRCGVSRMTHCVADVTGGVLPSWRHE